jgi:hypothetical protein
MTLLARRRWERVWRLGRAVSENPITAHCGDGGVISREISLSTVGVRVM